MLDNKKILIVDDNKMNRLIYQINLEKVGATVEFVARSRHAISRFNSADWDMVILDLELIGADTGFNIFEHLRSLPDWSGVPVIGVSSSNVSMIMPKVQQFGFDGFIAKPISSRLFIKQIRSVLDGHAVWNTMDFIAY